ncbi:uncharacterized protein LOC116849320 isoform X2 [Odontomachus brunneus]|uniref:uncharacterized protein LOC116849320 isoform X2 n=1 Tax=Odontomachus brunneus TaxID=486640 RepID=UPI0013F29A84|nr:uncharacterized protein LOC116849320 isoform X2 [Odontomachus brunneus]
MIARYFPTRERTIDFEDTDLLDNVHCLSSLSVDHHRCYVYLKEMRLTEKLKQEEEERLCVLAIPLRHYLATHVLPTLTEALIEVAKLRPEDPVDFLTDISTNATL